MPRTDPNTPTTVLATAWGVRSDDGTEPGPGKELHTTAGRARQLIDAGVARPLDEERPAEAAEQAPLGERPIDTSEVADPAPAPATADATSPSSVEAFDPSAHTVDEVIAHLETADEAERDRVLDAEGAGAARKGVLTA